MIHSASTISLIVKSLRSAGIKDPEVLEEMIDHYLTEIEILLEQGHDNEGAISNALSQINETHLQALVTPRRRVWPYFMIALLVVLGGSWYALQGTTAPDVDMSTASTNHIEAIHSQEPNGWPIEKLDAKITSHFGMRKHPITHKMRLHHGIDFRVLTGTPILATGDATVQEIGMNSKAGQYIILQHGDRYLTKYYHLSAISVREGDIISKGDVIGLSGNSGLSTTPHLHYEIIEENAAIDPMECIRA